MLHGLSDVKAGTAIFLTAINETAHMEWQTRGDQQVRSIDVMLLLQHLEHIAPRRRSHESFAMDFVAGSAITHYRFLTSLLQWILMTVLQTLTINHVGDTQIMLMMTRHYSEGCHSLS